MIRSRISGKWYFTKPICAGPVMSSAVNAQSHIRGTSQQKSIEIENYNQLIEDDKRSSLGRRKLDTFTGWR
ncbi:unnamed protein product [Clavelina lepadiformis]|uniref:Uncharacterized protein n=1 Tax=Clavelina lepadiformis TaxID=159417 RepID=A0ABP0G2Y7_CLALP